MGCPGRLYGACALADRKRCAQRRPRAPCTQPARRPARSRARTGRHGERARSGALLAHVRGELAAGARAARQVPHGQPRPHPALAVRRQQAPVAGACGAAAAPRQRTACQLQAVLRQWGSCVGLAIQYVAADSLLGERVGSCAGDFVGGSVEHEHADQPWRAHRCWRHSRAVAQRQPRPRRCPRPSPAAPRARRRAIRRRRRTPPPAWPARRRRRRAPATGRLSVSGSVQRRSPPRPTLECEQHAAQVPCLPAFPAPCRH